MNTSQISVTLSNLDIDSLATTINDLCGWCGASMNMCGCYEADDWSEEDYQD